MSQRYPCIYCTEDLHCTKYSDTDCESWCVLGPCKDETPSNADKIRKMTDEELGEFLIKLQLKIVYDFAELQHVKINCDREKCLKNMIGWLKKESE